MHLNKKLLSGFIFTSFLIANSVSAEIIWVDFGNTGNTTSGNWNNVTGVAGADDKTDLINSSGGTTGIGMNISSGSFTGASDFNGGVAADTVMFDPFEAASVITDAAFTNTGVTGTLAFSGLDSSLIYSFTMTGARTTDTERFTRYTITGFGTQTLQTSGNVPFAGNGVNWNNNSVVTIGGITGVTSVNLTIEANSLSDFTGSNQFGYINALEINSIPEPSTLVLFGLSGIAILAALRRRK